MLVNYSGGLVTFEIADDSPLALDILKREIRAGAEAAHAQYPQYAGHWDGAEWQIARITRTVRTKLGVAFESGELVLARKRTDEEITELEGLGVEAFDVAYSVRNGIDTSVRATDLEWLEEAGR